MKTPLLTFVYDRKKKSSSGKEASVELRITYERKQKYMTTGVRLLPKNWKRGIATGRLDAPQINETLELLMKDVRKVVNEMVLEGCICIDEIPNRLERMKREGVTFIEFAEERATVRKYGLSADSMQRYERFMRFFKKWGRIVYFSDITDKNILALDEWLSGKNMKPSSRWNNYHRFLNSFILDAIEEGHLVRNPYKRVAIKKESSKGGIGKYLTVDEFSLIENAKMPNACLERVRDLFVFQTYTCLSYVDLAAFDCEKIREIGGKRVYVGNRGKTGQEFTFLLLKPALRVLDKYNGKLPIISNVKYNDYLKRMAFYAGVERPNISTHWARHTGATLLLNKGGVDMEVVAKVLGHSSTKITRSVYAKLLDETVVDAMSGFDNKLLE